MLSIKENMVVGRVGYAPTTPAMSMQYSTIELTALLLVIAIKDIINLNLLQKYLFFYYMQTLLKSLSKI